MTSEAKGENMKEGFAKNSKLVSYFLFLIATESHAFVPEARILGSLHRLE
jgi:hypothetical protein